jgi:CRP-like cAMP-binding protein
MFKKKNLLRGNLLFKQGDVPKQVLFVYKGQVSYSYSWKITVENKLNLPLHKNTQARKTETFVILGAGEMIGEESLFKDIPLPYNVRTETECDFYVMEMA